MRKTDINKYNDEASAPVQPSAKTIAKDAGSFLLKTLLTLLFVGIFTGIVILVSVIFYIAGALVLLALIGTGIAVISKKRRAVEF